MPTASSRQVLSQSGQCDLPSLQLIDCSFSRRSDISTHRKSTHSGDPKAPEQSVLQQNTMSMSHQPALWEEQPILTDAARQKRENEATRRAAEKQKQAERERKFQEELVQFKRQVQTPAKRLPT